MDEQIRLCVPGVLLEQSVLKSNVVPCRSVLIVENAGVPGIK